MSMSSVVSGLCHQVDRKQHDEPQFPIVNPARKMKNLIKIMMKTQQCKLRDVKCNFDTEKLEIAHKFLITRRLKRKINKPSFYC